jgi:nitroimidazol reductase NimA-like FMN-containing flavoprotein (pyridoxamine 5'-phosphate oxidase superfamily)
MRRKDKEITHRAQIDGIIHESDVCRLALSKDDSPYLIPLSFGYDGESIYIHTAEAGKKISYFEANNQVCFEFERNVRLRSDRHDACKWSFEFESVIGFGAIHEVIEPAEKACALGKIMSHYSGREWDIDEDRIARVRVWKISIDSLTGKAS